MVGCFPFHIFISIFVFLESIFVLTRSWHTHITFFLLQKLVVNKLFFIKFALMYKPL